MAEIEHLKLPLNAQSLQQYEPLLSEASKLFLSEPPINGLKVLAIAGMSEGKPVGLAVATFNERLFISQIDFFKVLESHREALGPRLLDELEKELRSIKSSIVSITYPQLGLQSQYLESLLKMFGWAPPTVFKIHCKFDAVGFQPSWFRKGYRYAPGITIFPWKELTVKERERIELQLSQGVVPSIVSPFAEEEKIEHLNSLGLRKNGEVIGWVITHRDNPDTIRYFALYIHRKYQKEGDAIKLLCDSLWLHRAKAFEIPRALLEVNVMQSSQSWITFMKKRLIPHTVEVHYDMYSWKKL